MKAFEKNFYGLAVVKYTLGYVHHKFIEMLCDTSVSSTEYGEYLFQSR